MANPARAASPAEAWPFVTVVVPALNEERYIAPCLLALLQQDYPGDFEILVFDAGSADRTREIVAQMAAGDRRIRLLANPGRLQSIACNLGAMLADPSARIMVRADAHSEYPPGFISICVGELVARSATSVVVKMRAVGLSKAQSTIAALQNSWLGNGGSAHRRGGEGRFVEHGHHAAFDLAFYRQVGGYDETFSHNEDAELDCRMIEAGGRIWMSGTVSVEYFPRTTLWSLARQYFNHGRGRARMLLTHRVLPRPRQMAPLVFLGGCVGGVALSPLSLLFLAVPGLYALICSIAGMRIVRSAGLPLAPSAGVLAMAVHLGWATGFLCGVAKYGAAERPVWRAGPVPVSRVPGSGMVLGQTGSVRS